ncbi:MAG: right-handed parallel beta-helix repeat-containing protein, partial [Armatimonadota bacterium]
VATKCIDRWAVVEITDTGDGGIVLSGGDRNRLTPAELFAENNRIHEYSRWSRTYRPAVGVFGVGNRVAHNLIYDGPHNGIQLSGNDHVIEFNEIHNVCYETGDVGAFYMGRDWTARGTVIRNNYFHDINGPGQLGAMGIYLDDQASGITITGNLFRKVTRAVFIGGGDDNRVTNNVFVDCVPSVHLDARGLGWQKPATDGPKGTLRTQYAAVPVTSDVWTKKYPSLVSSVTVGDPGAPTGNLVERNVSLGGRWSDVEAKAKTGITFKDNLTDADPLFVNPVKNDFRLKSNSPA